MAVLRTSLFYLLFGLFSLLVVPLAATLAPLSDRLLRASARFWAAGFVWMARVLLGMRLVVRGRVPQSGVLVASKHQSYYEAIATLHLFDNPAVVMKAQLRKIPFWGSLAARHGSIFVSRERHGSALRAMLRAARDRMEGGRLVFIFPEGTRTAPGARPAVKSGLFALYRALERPVVPVALDAGRCWVRGFAKRPGTITISFLPEIPPGLPRPELDARVHAAINLEPTTAEVRA